MKKMFLALFVLACSFSFAQDNKTVNPSLQQILTFYYGVKDALVKDDASTASSKAQQLLEAVKNADTKSLGASEQQALASVKEALEHNADHISEVNSIDHQREHFAALSQAMSTLAQSVELSQEPVYLEYCAMKKSYWLSNDKKIKNPYYGKEMLSCGSVKKKLAPAGSDGK